MATDIKDQEERGHSARYLVLIFLLCVATCGIFFSLGFVVGYNQRGMHSMPMTEVVNTPSVVPPTYNPPPDASAPTAQPAAPATGAPNSAPDTEVVPPAGGATPSPPAVKPADGNQPAAPPQPAANPAPNPSSAPPPAAGEVAEGITIQVEALRTKQDAEKIVDILKERGYPVFLVTPEYAHADDNLYRVQVGPFRARADADKVRDKLSKEGFKPFIKH